MLIVENLTFGFHRRPLFRDLSFSVEPGTLLTITGANGAGKSTLMAIIAGLLNADDGFVQLQDSAGKTVSRQEYLEYLGAEHNGLFTSLAAIPNLQFWLQLRGRRSAPGMIHAELARWQLDHPIIATQLPVSKYSTGMKRRLALARVCLMQAPCWLLDEPFYGLDAKAITVFQDRLAAHLDASGSAVIISHDLHPLKPFSAKNLDLSMQS